MASGVLEDSTSLSLRGSRNKLVHYQGVITGMGGSETDNKYLRQDADKALKAISPLLAGLERF